MKNNIFFRHFIFVALLSITSAAWAKNTDAKIKSEATPSSSATNVKPVSSKKEKKAALLAPERLSIMTYNVENLFDTIDDPKTEDETYLPLTAKKNNPEIAMRCQRLRRDHWREQCLKTDWTERRLKRKMQRLADVIRLANDKKGADIIVMPEVENLEILERFRKEYLADLYPQPAILIDGEDIRGIDVGMFSRLPLKSKPQLHNLKFIVNDKVQESDIRPTRGILEAEFELPTGESLFVFGAHFPSQGAPTELRRQALAQLAELMKSKPSDSYSVAAGDFNITREEDAEHSYYPALHDKGGLIVAHFVGCKGCRGTHYYHPKRSWSFLDTLIFTSNFAQESSPWQLDKDSIKVFNKSIYQINRYGSPARFAMGNTKEGVSDHWPIMADITYKKSLPQPKLILGDAKSIQIEEIKKDSALNSKNKKVIPLKKAAKPEEAQKPAKRAL